MKTFSYLFRVSLSLMAAAHLHAAPADPPPAQPSLVIAVASTAPPDIQKAAASILAAASTQPLLVAMAGGHPPTALSDSVALAAAEPPDRAYCHLVIVGLPTDPLIEAAWQREAKAQDGDFYIFGFGHFKGDIGYIESDRNPFLHSRFISTAPFETEVVTITGSSPAGVTLAAQAFISNGLVNGVVGGPGWQRAAPNLLQHDPLAPTFALPAWVPAQLGDWTKVGVTQGAEDEYRGVVQDTTVSPQEIWRVKYYKPGVWDKPGADNAMQNYSEGLHRRAYGNTLWMARFASPEEATEVAPKIAEQAHLGGKLPMYVGKQGAFGFATDSSGPLTLWQRGDWLLMSTLPKGVAESAVGPTANP